MTLPSSRIKYVCSCCGSESVLIDAWAEWDTAKQAWHLADVFESTARCSNCDGECKVEAKPIDRPSFPGLHLPA